MIQLGLTGFPLGHSLSPTIHTAALQSCGLAGEYRLYPAPPDDPPALADLLQRLRAGEIDGLNVTIPHKQAVIPLLDALTPTAQAIGAVNTIYRRENQLVGDNTDAPGFWADLNQVFDFSTLPTRPAALVLGAGGSARAVVYALLSHGWQVALAARRLEQAQQLAQSLGDEQIHPSDYLPLTLQSFPFNLLVNTTPLGMTPDIESSPWPAHFPFPPNAAVYDLVYNPPATQLVKAARAQGLNAVTGLGMLIEQAALAFERWTGCSPARPALRSRMTNN